MKKLFTICFLIGVMVTGYAQDLKQFESEGKKGFKNADGEIVIPAVYDNATDFLADIAFVSSNKKVLIIDRTGKITKTLKYDKLQGVVGGREQIAVALNDKVGRIDYTGKEIIPPVYDAIWPRVPNFKFALASKNKKMGIIDNNGKVVTPFIYDYVTPFVSSDIYAEKLYKVELGEKSGVVDANGNEILPPVYDRINHKSKEKLEVQLNGKIGYYNFDTKKITYTIRTKEEEELWIMKADNTKDRFVVTQKFGDFYPFESGGKKGYKNMADEIVIKPAYDYAGYFYSGLAVVAVNGKGGYIDKTGAVVIPCIYDNADDFHDDTAFVSLDEQVLMIDKKGKVLKVLKYDALGKGVYKRDQVFVGLNNKRGTIDYKGNEMIPPIYDAFWPVQLSEEVLFVGLNNKIGVVSVTGKVIRPVVYDLVMEFYDCTINSLTLYKVKTGGKFGVIDDDGDEILPPIYDRINHTRDRIEVQLDGQFGYYDKATKKIIHREMTTEKASEWIKDADNTEYSLHISK